MSADKILDYDMLVGTYTNNLDVTLRGFRPAEEMLDTWVPDDDLIRSLSSLVEAAQLCGSNAVSVRISTQTLADETAGSVKEKLESLGEVALEEEKESVTFTVSRLQETAAFRSVRPIYQQKLRERFANLKFKRPVHSGENQISLRATEENLSLTWAVESDKHVIADAAFEGCASGPTMAVLDSLCEILVGLPVLEAREHAVIRLELLLRTSGLRHSVSGIILPQNADPLFRLPSLLVHRLYDDYRTSTGYVPGANNFDSGPRPEWRALSPAEREQRLAAVLASEGVSLKLEENDVQVAECRFPYAVTIQFGDRLSIPAKRKLALQLERLFRKQCDPRLEVFCEEKKDLSKLRRLTGAES